MFVPVVAWSEKEPSMQTVLVFAANQGIKATIHRRKLNPPSDTSASDSSMLEFVRYTNFLIIMIIIIIIIIIITD